ncbi:MAG: hypothetical protein UT37_C0002G0021 [Parcubacteria group bacterium GW2011_GWA2_39_18]|nr:MAG: hypothetical protein UT37_C0002G0021 [Parcubacteria group bacterium GW2011_GWA2_39_18]
MHTAEPWKINRENVYYRIITGWASDSFNKWLIEISEKYGLNKDDLLLGVVETIRKISYRTIEILEWQTKIRNKVQIPPFIVTLNLKGYMGAIHSQLRAGKNFNDLCDKKEFLSAFGLFGQLVLELAGLNEILRTLNEGLQVSGIASNSLTAYNQLMIQTSFEEFLKANQKLQSSESRFELPAPIHDHNSLIRVVAEETMHYFDHQTNPQLMESLFERVREKSGGTKDPEKILDMKQGAEKELGLKDRAEQIFSTLKNQEDLFSPLKERLSRV